MRSVAIASVAAGLALVVSACGGGGGGGTTSSSISTAGKTFPMLKVVWGTPDYMDPGLSTRVESWQLFQDTYLGLVVKARVSCQTADCTRILPGLATTTGSVTDGGKHYVFTLRKGLKYSDGQAIKASDFASTIIRDFKMSSPGIGFFANIVGSDACEANPPNCKTISGIATNDTAGTVRIRLKQPESDFLYVLSIPFASVVPSATPQKDTENPPPAANGPYYIASYNPSKSFVLKRNPYWKKGAIPAIPDGNPAVIKATISSDRAQSAQLVASDQYMYDENLLPTDQLAHYESKYSDQIKSHTTPSTYYFFMNQRSKPFSSLQVRQAVNYAINRQQLAKLRGGLGVPTQNFLPPSYPQYVKIDPYPYNLQKAKQLVQQSGMKGQRVTVYTISDVAVDRSTGEYLQGQLKKIGFSAALKPLPSANYFTIVGNQATKAQIGVADWFEYYPYPSDWFDILQNGENITQTHNNNYGNVNHSSINKEIDVLDGLPADQARSGSTDSRWAAVDKDLMVKYASTAPYLNGIETSFFSSDMDVGCDIFTDNFDDIAQFCKK